LNARPTDLAFKQLIPRMNRYRDDLKAAGIPYVDEKKEHADFHALRKTFGTELAKSGVPFRVAMELMRHSDPNLTAKTYTDAGMLPVRDAVAGLALATDTNRHKKLVESRQACPRLSRSNQRSRKC
jgi:integrase